MACLFITELPASKHKPEHGSYLLTLTERNVSVPGSSVTLKFTDNFFISTYPEPRQVTIFKEVKVKKFLISLTNS